MSVDHEFDEYGFLVQMKEETDGSTTIDDSDRCHSYSPQPSDAVAKQWEDTLDSWSQDSDSSQQLRLLLRKGLPRSVRSKAWQLFLGTHTLKAQSTLNYQTKLSELQARLSEYGVSEHSTEQDVRVLNHILDNYSKARAKDPPHSKDEISSDPPYIKKNISVDPPRNKVFKEQQVKTLRQIMVDVGRSFPSHCLFMGEAAAGRRALLRLLTLYAEYNPTVGYCQGMAYIAGLLYMTFDEEETAFWALVSLLERPKYLAGYYDTSMSRLQTHADMFALMLKEKLPHLSAHLDELGVHPLVYVTPWFMCLFTSLPCWDTVLAIADLFFLEGCNTIFRVALAIMKASAPEVTALYRLDQVLPFLQHLPSRLVSLGHLLPLVWRTPVSKWEVDLYLDMASSGRGSVKQVGTRKRAAVDEMDGEALPATKRRRKGAQTPAPPKPSLLDRIINVFTPIRQSKTPFSHAHRDTPTDCQSTTSHTPITQSRKRKRGDGFDLSVSCPGIQGDGIELVNFSRITPTAKLFPDSPFTPAQRPTPKIEGGVVSPHPSQDRELRRSVRIARRRSVCQNSPGALPSASVLSPLSVRPLQDHVQSTNHPREHLAFRLFTTPTPIRAQEKNSSSSTPSHVTSPPTLRTPEVELKQVNFKMNKNILTKYKNGESFS